MDHRPNCKIKTMKVPKETLGENLYNYDLSIVKISQIGTGRINNKKL